jgi:hypothetical protein
MAQAAPAMTRHELEAKIVRRCWTNEEFRQEFLRDPKAAFVRHLGVPADQLPDVVVHEEPPGAWHVVLPARPTNAGELSDAELEQVAGGITPVVAMVTMWTALGAGTIAGAVTGQDGW